MSFLDWDSLARAGLFGATFLLALCAVLWAWYDSSVRPGRARWVWRIALSLLVALTLPAVVLGAANVDASQETLLNVLGWLALAAGAAAFIGVGAFAAWGRAPFLDPLPPLPPFPDPVESTIPNLQPVPPPPPSPRKPVEAYFFVKDGPARGCQFPLDGVTFIGRGEGCEILVDDRRMSGRHAQVKRTGDSWVFTDLESTNGSYLLVAGRDEPIRQPQALVDGDRLRLGHTVFEFVDTRRERR